MSTNSALFLLELSLDDIIPPFRNGRVAESVRAEVLVVPGLQT
jgi:hypothetical protein